jgi:ribosomal protein S18 acetylase RimI-like enzyme
MAYVRTLTLSPEQRDELVGHRDHDPRPYVRERCAALLKIADGTSPFAVAKAGILKPRDPDTVYSWLNTYEAGGLAGVIAHQHGGPRRGCFFFLFGLPHAVGVIDKEVYESLFPDWRVHQGNAVEQVCTSDDAKVWVAVESGVPVGFVAVKYDAGGSIGEIYMIAVDPDHQRRGVAETLTGHALDEMKAAGVSVAMVETGGDPGHAGRDLAECACPVG